MEKYNIGKIVNAAGLKGEVKVYNYSDSKERFAELDNIYVEEKNFSINKVRYMKEMVILKLEGIDDRNAAESLKNKNLYINEEMLRVLPEDTYYVKDLVGLRAVTPEGELLGTVTDVIQNSSQDLYEIELESKKRILVPAVEEFILDINTKDGTMMVKLIEGLLDL